MRIQLLRSRPVLLAVVAATLIFNLSCGVVNPAILGGAGSAASVSGIEGNIVILVMNLTPVAAQANVEITKTNGGILALNIPVPALDHEAVVENCDVQTVQFVQGSYAGPGGAVLIPGAVSPLEVGLTLQCGGVVAITISGAPPSVFVNVQGF